MRQPTEETLISNYIRFLSYFYALNLTTLLTAKQLHLQHHYSIWVEGSTQGNKQGC